MRVHCPASVPGQKGVLAVLEIDLTSKGRRVRVEARDGLEPLDLKGEKVGGTYDLPDAIQHLTVPLRVTRDGGGRAHVQVTVTDAKAPTVPETWSGDVTLDTPIAVAATRSRAGLVGAFVAVVAAIGVFVILPMFRTPTVPRLTNKTQEEAERDLKSHGYSTMTRIVETDDPAKDGRVVGQFPESGESLARGQQVEIRVARRAAAAPGVPEAADAVAPDLVGKTIPEASDALATLGVTTTVAEEDAPDEQVGRVLSQRPAAGRAIPAGGTIELFVGRRRGPSRDVPEVVSLSREDAERAIGDRKLVAKVTEEESAPDVVGRVVRQSPKGGERVAEGSAVEIVVGRAAGAPPPSTAPAPGTPPGVVAEVDVPDVVTRLRADAERTIRDAGLVPDVTVAPGPAPAGFEDAVTEQKPAGRRLARGATVRLTVGAPAASATPAPGTAPTPATPPEATGVAVPDVLGLDRGRAEGDLQKAGLAFHVTLEDVADPDAPVGIVLRQTPPVGDRLAAGGTVELLVSRRPPPKAGTLPTAVGRNEWDATAELRELGYYVRIRYVDGEASKKGQVLEQSPAAGTAAVEKSWVELTVVRGGPPAPPPRR